MAKRFIVDVWQGSEYASNFEDDSVLNISGLWIYHGSRYASVTQGFEYTWIILGYAWLCLFQLFKTVCFRDEVWKSVYWCCRMGKHSKVSSTTKWRLGENIVLRLMVCLTPTISFDTFMDNYFISFRLLTHLGANNIKATRMLNKNRLHECTINWNKHLQKKGTWRLWTAHIKQKTSVTLTVVGWNHSSAIYKSCESKRFVWCWNKVEKNIFKNNNQISCTVTTGTWVLSKRGHFVSFVMYQNVAKYWYPNENMVVIPVCLNGRCYEGCGCIA